MSIPISPSALPISPDEVVAVKRTLIPSVVIESFNELIARKWNGYSSSFTQNEVINLILEKWPSSPEETQITRSTIFKEHWLDVEDIYRNTGWIVTYDKPGYNETYEARFIFDKKKARLLSRP